MGEIKKSRTEKLGSAFSDLSKAAFDACLTFKQFSAVLESLDEAAKRGSKIGRSLCVRLLNESGPDKE
jgi:hypothetical protein